MDAELVNVYGCIMGKLLRTVVAQQDLGRGLRAAGGEHRLEKPPHARHVDVPKLGTGGYCSLRRMIKWVGI